MASPGLLVERVDGGGGRRPGERRTERFWKTVDVHGTDGSTVAAGAPRVAAGRAAAPRGRVVERVSPLRLLAGADRLPLSLWGSRGGGGGREAHRGQAGAGAAIVAGPGGESQSVTDGSQLTSSSLQ